MTNQSRNNPGNFARDPERAREAGRKGGQASHRGRNRSENDRDRDRK
jgi:general stress protein YciG